MRILFFGDIVGSSGRHIVKQNLANLKKKLNLDLIIANAENAAHGFGLTPKMFQSLQKAGVQVMTMGNHTWDKQAIIPVLQENDTLVRPLNYPEGTVGHGFCIYQLPDGRKAAVVQVLGRVFMRAVEDPYLALKNFCEQYHLGKDVNAIIVDIHGEATSEKMALGFLMDGKASLVVGTHTHIPTADAMVLPQGTGYMTDVGMCGDYYSVIGMEVKTVIPRFVEGMPSARLEPATSDGTLCAVFVQTDDATGKCVHIRPIRIGAHLINAQ